MYVSYQQLQWVVQQNLTTTADFDNIREACDRLGIYSLGLQIIPFTDELPTFDRSRHTIVYGSTTFNRLAYRDPALRPGVFFDEARFSIANYMQHWGRHMLNYGARITTFRDLVSDNQYAPDQLLFIRPDDDNKAFAGEVKRFSDIAGWYEQLCAIPTTTLSPNSAIVAAEPFDIAAEWRLWMVEGKVIAASKYREYFQLKKEQGCPAEVAAFAEARCLEYMPHPVFVMDICRCGDAYYIVECGCMNGAGFYKADIKAIVEAVSSWFVTSLP